nr:hypothetical protein [Tanacetum cinerariifolium]
MGELTFFLSLQVKQKKDEIFISQDKYVAKILRKFRLTKGKSYSTSIDTEKPLLKDLDGEDIDVHAYRSMIGSLMYLISSRPDIMFAAEYIAAASCYAQVLWIHNQLLDYSDSPLLGVNTPRSDEDRLELMGLTDNDVTRMQALVDKKKVVVTEATIRDLLWLDDAEGVDCMPNEEIFVKLARMV